MFNRDRVFRLQRARGEREREREKEGPFERTGRPRGWKVRGGLRRPAGRYVIFSLAFPFPGLRHHAAASL